MYWNMTKQYTILKIQNAVADWGGCLLKRLDITTGNRYLVPRKVGDTKPPLVKEWELGVRSETWDVRRKGWGLRTQQMAVTKWEWEGSQKNCVRAYTCVSYVHVCFVCSVVGGWVGGWVGSGRQVPSYLMNAAARIPPSLCGKITRTMQLTQLQANMFGGSVVVAVVVVDTMRMCMGSVYRNQFVDFLSTSSNAFRPGEGN